jgi:hypothetical protein
MPEILCHLSCYFNRINRKVRRLLKYWEKTPNVESLHAAIRKTPVLPKSRVYPEPELKLSDIW